MKHARSDYDRFQDPAGIIPEGEPVFIIWGQDIVAPAVLDYYADQAMKNGADKELVDAVLKHSDAMRRWQYGALIEGVRMGGHGNKVPDGAKGVFR